MGFFSHIESISLYFQIEKEEEEDMDEAEQAENNGEMVNMVNIVCISFKILYCCFKKSEA